MSKPTKQTKRADDAPVFLIGQRVILSGTGGVREIGLVVPSETEHTRGVWVLSPTRKYAADYDLMSVAPLPGGQL